MNKVCVVIPVYNSELSLTEEISFRRNTKILKDYDIAIVHPKGLNLERFIAFAEVSKTISFNANYFDSVKGYNKLLLSKDFYSVFSNYEYILICQLDTYVFHDALEKWINYGFDYVGAPVFDLNEPELSFENPVTLNGGFSLRKTSSALRVLTSYSFINSFHSILKKNITSSGSIVGSLKAIYFFLTGNNTHHRLNKYVRNEDLFWALIAKRNFSWFKVPPPELSLLFAIDNQPSQAIKQLHEKTPFACHGFNKRQEFWKLYIPELNSQ